MPVKAVSSSATVRVIETLPEGTGSAVFACLRTGRCGQAILLGVVVVRLPLARGRRRAAVAGAFGRAPPATEMRRRRSTPLPSRMFTASARPSAQRSGPGVVQRSHSASRASGWKGARW